MSCCDSLVRCHAYCNKVSTYQGLNSLKYLKSEHSEDQACLTLNEPAGLAAFYVFPLHPMSLRLGGESKSDGDKGEDKAKE